MRKNRMKFSLMLLLSLLCYGMASAVTTVTFDATIDIDNVKGNAQNENVSLEKDGVTFFCSYGNFGDGNAYRLYKSSTVTISVASGVIQSISFSPSTYTGYPLSGLVAQTGSYDGTTGTWSATSNVNSVSFVPSAQVRTAKVVVTLAGEGDLDYSPTLTDGFTFWPVMDKEAEAQVTITPYSGTLAYYTTDGSEPTVNSARTSTAKTITITGTTTVKAGSYVGGAITNVVTRTYTLGKTYNGVRDFLEHATVGEDIRLYWSDEMNARVLHTTSTQAFIRDNTGAMVFYGITTTPALAKDQHLAGWIKGRVGDYGGVKQLNSNDYTTSTEIVIAEPVTEEAIFPVVINSVDDFDDHQNDLVTLRNVRYNKANGLDNQGTFGGSYNGGTIRFYNRFYLSDFAYPYENALVDLTGLAIPYNYARQIAAISMDDYYTYVINEDSTHVAPPEALSGVKVRLQRNLFEGTYQTMCLPFDVTSEQFPGEIYRYTGVTAGSKELVNFVSATSISAGTPFLAKVYYTSDGLSFADANFSTTAGATVSASGGHNYIGMLQSGSLPIGSQAINFDGRIITIEQGSNYGYQRGSTAYLGGAFIGESNLYLTIDGTIVGQITPTGDLNGDGQVNAGDVSELYTLILAGDYTEEADLNGDGQVNAGDISELYSIILGGGSNSVIVKPVSK